MNINNKFNIGDMVYIKTDTEQRPNIIIAITIYSDEYITYKLNSNDTCSDYRDYEISNEMNKLTMIKNY
jgi:hypothetical protein